MLNHTYTSIKNANLVDSGNTQHITSQPSALIKSNYLGEFRTELDKKKVLANLGIATSLSLEWEYIKGDIGRSAALMQEFDARTNYISQLDGLSKTVADGIRYLESIIGSEEDVETEQNSKIEALETSFQDLQTSITGLKDYLDNTVDVNIETLNQTLETISEKVNNITTLIQVSSKAGNALSLVGDSDVEEGETTGLYVPDLSPDMETAKTNIEELQSNVTSILDTYVTKEQLGGGDFNFVNQSTFEGYTTKTDESISNIQQELDRTVKTGEDGHVDQLYVNKISKNNNNDNIKISDSFEVESGIPLDVRFVVEDLAQLLQLPVKVCYPGMGVIVNSLSALYILRKPDSGVTFNQEYVSNVYNWKCPEDLVTVALSRPEYEQLEEINPNVFYYIYEEEISRTKEPVRESFDTEEEFKVAWQEWVQSLKVLSQEYMSASWGVEMEEKLGKKASQDSVAFLLSEVDKIKGSGDGTSLESLNAGIQELQTTSQNLESQILNILDQETETGRLVDAESRIKVIEDSLPEYITEEELATLSGGFDFVKPDVYEQDKQTLLNNLAQSITTESVVTNTINLSGSVITSSDGNVQVDDAKLAKVSDLPVIQVMTQADYDSLDSKDDGTYYYTYDGDTIYVTKSELDTKVSKLQQDITTLLGRIVTLESQLEQLLNQSPETPEDSES